MKSNPAIPGTRRPDLELRRLQTQAMVDLARIRHASEAIVESALKAEGLDDITPAQANALLVLVNARSPLTAARLAEALSLTEVTVGRFVRAMEKAGWVERRRDPGDARARLLVPTRKTRDRLPAFIRVSNTLLDRAFDGVDRDGIVRMAATLAAIRDRLRGASELG